MKEFLAANWLALIGALAWLPILIEIILNLFRKCHFVYLDKRFIYNVSVTFKNNGFSKTEDGMVFIMALNLFVYKYPFFPKKIECLLKLQNGAEHRAKLYEGKLGYSDSEQQSGNHIFNFPDVFNMNTSRAIFADKDNIRILPFFFENLNMKNDDSIKQITITFYGRFFKKKITMKNADCEKMDLISKYDKIVEG